MGKIGGYAVVLKAAGLESVGPSKKPKITNQIFEIDLNSHLAKHLPRTPKNAMPWPKIAVMGDMHEPFGHTGVKTAFIEFCAEHQPEYIVQVGDPVDFFAHSKFPASRNILKPKEEEDLAKRNLTEFWAALNEKCPTAKKIMLLGNHSIRPLKRVLETVPSIEHWAEKYLQEFLTFPNVQTIMDTREEFTIGDIAFIHGHLSQLGQHRDLLLTNVVCGHTHRGGVVFRSLMHRGATQGEIVFELNAGLAADLEAKAMSYTSTKSTGWTLGWGYIDSYGPRFIPFRQRA